MPAALRCVEDMLTACYSNRSATSYGSAEGVGADPESAMLLLEPAASAVRLLAELASSDSSLITQLSQDQQVMKRIATSPC